MRALQINSQGRLLGTDVHWHKSPHFDERVGEIPLSLVVIHNISLPAGEFGTGYVQALFDATIDTSAHPTFESLKGLEVSSHFFIDRKGEIWQFVETENAHGTQGSPISWGMSVVMIFLSVLRWKEATLYLLSPFSTMPCSRFW